MELGKVLRRPQVLGEYGSVREASWPDCGELLNVFPAPRVSIPAGVFI